MLRTISFLVPFDILISKMLLCSIFDQFQRCCKFFDHLKSNGSLLTLRVNKWKKCLRWDFDSSKEASCCTECNATKISSWRHQERPLKISKIKHFFIIIFLQKRYFAKGWLFLRCIQCIKMLCMSYQYKSWKKKNQFFTVRGDSFDIQGDFFSCPTSPTVKQQVDITSEKIFVF